MQEVNVTGKEIMKLKGLVPLAAAGAAVVLIAGCSPAPGLAAQVEDRTISLAALEETIESCTEAGAQWATVPDQEILSSLVLMQSAKALSDQNQLGITDEDATLSFQQNPGAARMADFEACWEYNRDSVFFSAVLEELTVPTFLEQLAELDVQLNPRFGEWQVNPTDPQNPVGIGGSGSLSVTGE